MNRTRRLRCGLVGVLLASAMAFPNSLGAQAPQDGPGAPAAPPGVEHARWIAEQQKFKYEISRLRSAGRWDEAAKVAREELARAREADGELHDHAISALAHLAAMEQGRGDWAAARKLLEEMITLRERQPNVKDWQVGDARHALAYSVRLAAMTPLQRAQLKEANRLVTSSDTQRVLKKYDAAMKEAREAERIFRELFGEDDRTYARGLGAVANVYTARGDHARAEPLFRRMVEILKRTNGESHPSYANALIGLAEVRNKMGDYAGAEPLFRQAVASYTEAYGYSDWVWCRVVLERLGSLYLERGDYSRAEPVFRQLEAVVLTICAGGDPEVARRPAETARKLARGLFGEDHPGYAGSLEVLARVHLARADYPPAEPLLRQAVEIRRKAQGESHPDYAAALNALAGLDVARGDYAAAEPLFRRALEIVRKGPGESHPDYAAALVGLAGLDAARGDYAAAEPLLRQAVEIMKRTRGESHPDSVGCLNDLANLYRDMGDDARAEPLYLRTLEIAATMKAVRTTMMHPCYPRVLQDLAELYRAQGDYARAEPLLRGALGDWRKPGDLGHASALDALATLYLEMGDDSRAGSLLGQALEIRRKAQGTSHPDYAGSLNGLARVYAARGDHARAEPLLRQALEIRKGALGASHPGYAAALGDLADLDLARGDYARAEPLLRQALEIRKRSQGASHPDYATALGGLARLSAARGDYAGAEPLYREALEVRRKAQGASHPGYAAAMGDLAELYLARGDYPGAEPLLRRALDQASTRLRSISSILGERQRLRLFAASRRYLDGFLSAAPEVGAPTAELYARVLDWKGAVDVDLAEERLARDRPELRLTLEELAQIRASLARLTFAPERFMDPRSSWHQKYADLSARKDGLEADLATRSAAFRQARRGSAPGPEHVAASLSGEEALIDLFEYTRSGPPEGGPGPPRRERRLLAFVVRPGRPVALVALGPARPVTEAVRSARAALVAGRADSLETASAELGRRVCDPLRPHLAGARTVLIAPDGALMAFPFAALPGGRPGSYLIEDLAIGYVASGRQLVAMNAVSPGPAGRGLLAVGGVDFQADPGRERPSERPPLATPAPSPVLVQRGGFAPLPGTLPEVESARALYRAAFADQPADLLVGAEASEGALKRRLDGGRVRVVHLATHGFFESPDRFDALRAEWKREEPPFRPAPADRKAEDRTVSALTPLVRSGVVLAGGGAIKPEPIQFASNIARSGGRPVSEDGILTAEEVRPLDLRGTELVVLSACETGLGDLEAGQGVLGLQRAFHAAGARAVVASLWRVDDLATRALMERFYANLWTKKLPKREALRQAQLDVLRDPSLVEARRAQPSPRGIGAVPEPLPGGGKVDPARPGGARRGDPALWAAFLLSGDGR